MDFNEVSALLWIHEILDLLFLWVTPRILIRCVILQNILVASI